MQICDLYQIKLLYTFSHSLRHFLKYLTLTYVRPPMQTQQKQWQRRENISNKSNGELQEPTLDNISNKSKWRVAGDLIFKWEQQGNNESKDATTKETYFPTYKWEYFVKITPRGNNYQSLNSSTRTIQRQVLHTSNKIINKQNSRTWFTQTRKCTRAQGNWTIPLQPKT